MKPIYVILELQGLTLIFVILVLILNLTQFLWGQYFQQVKKIFLKTNCKPKKNSGNLCDLVSASGTILAIRQTINYDVDGRPILEQYSLPEGVNN